MSDIMRDISLSGLIFGSTASYPIPDNPSVGMSYRNTELDKGTTAKGWPFATVVDSGDFNQIMYKITSVLDAIEVQGILFWSSVTDYVAGSIVRRTAGGSEKFFEALQPSGPSSQPRDPSEIGNIGTYWKEASIGGGASGGYAVQFVSSNVSVEKGNLYFCTAGGIQLTLPTIGLTNGDKIKIATGRTIGLNSTVTITGESGGNGTIESSTGSADNNLIIDTPFSSVELVYNSTSGLWKVCSPICQAAYLTSSVPVGSLIAYSANVEPPGFFICDGRAVSRLTYSELFAVIGTSYGSGDGLTTFNIPDFRGKFLRGYGVSGQQGIGSLQLEGNGGFSGDFGEEQKEQLPNITGYLKFHSADYGDGKLFTNQQDVAEVAPDTNVSKSPSNRANFDASKSNSVYVDNGHVTPANYAVHFLIKY